MLVRLSLLVLAVLPCCFAGMATPPENDQVKDDQASIEVNAAERKLKAEKILFLGNSITLHGPLESIGWSGNWGMAASEASKDYVHLLTDRFSNAAGSKPETLVKNIADFERGYVDYRIEEKLRDALEFRADIIVVAIGENVSSLDTEESRFAFQLSVTNLLKQLKGGHHPRIFVRTTFWTDEVKNRCLAEACKATDSVLVDLGKLDADEANFARSERTIEHAGVAGHPGDQGMQAIADILWKAIEKSETP
ncbi:MAG: SGNH/GDSL hydrolase family protein [Planctomyces sp.]|nr:SGNH/GDSL hydrolase family protein [Planctomyces sp.]